MNLTSLIKNTATTPMYRKPISPTLETYWEELREYLSDDGQELINRLKNTTPTQTITMTHGHFEASHGGFLISDQVMNGHPRDHGLDFDSWNPYPNMRLVGTTIGIGEVRTSIVVYRKVIGPNAMLVHTKSGSWYNVSFA